MLAACIWGHNRSQKRIVFYCDNKAAVTAINKGTSSSPLIAKLLRVLTLRSMQGNFLVRASHVPGKTNGIADALSRKQMQWFFHLAPEACHLPTEIQGDLLQTLMP